MTSKEKNQQVEEEVIVNQEDATPQGATEELVAEEVATEETQAELTPEEKMAAEVAEAQAQTEEWKDKYLRLSAEFDNYRKRTLKEKAELIKNAGEKTITAILPVLDDFERALQNMEKAENVEALREGLDLICSKFAKTLTQQGLNKIETAGQAFDTDFHEAIALVPAPSEAEKGKILDCVQTGYLLNEKVIRHAKVVVGQ
ncbi:MAG: nucleotide exchange factor GrpE [Phocaeicola sp.]